MSSDFFGGLQSGIRFPSTQINQNGPLPGAPYTSFDGKINNSESLLGNVLPYSGAKKGAMGSDRNYQQIPHRMQQIVPMLFLPSADTNISEPCRVSHPVDFGDVAFSLCANNVVALMSQNKQAINMVRAPARNVFCNLCTVNYMLAGLQRIQAMQRSAWTELAENLGYNYDDASQDSALQVQQLLRLLSTRILPYGIVQASEKQGGQHEMTLAPVQAAANFVVTMTVDGQNRDLVNYWRDSQISAGDQLIYVLEKRSTKKFHLNHYRKAMALQIFPDEKVCWQLVPRVYCAAEETRFKQEAQAHDLNLYDYRVDGYWRIGQSFQHRAAMHDSRNYADDQVFMKGQLLQITFAPVWVQMDPYKVSRKRKTQAVANSQTTSKNLKEIILAKSRTNVNMSAATPQLSEVLQQKNEASATATPLQQILMRRGAFSTASAVVVPAAAVSVMPVPAAAAVSVMAVQAPAVAATPVQAPATAPTTQKTAESVNGGEAAASKPTETVKRVKVVKR